MRDIGLLKSTRNLMCIGFTIKSPVWYIYFTGFLGILRIFSGAHCLVFIYCDKAK